jgi:hypothetical protein
MRDIVKLEGDTERYVKMQEIDLGGDIKRSTEDTGRSGRGTGKFARDAGRSGQDTRNSKEDAGKSGM